jgi:DNA-binding NarL/FixJ family response regulator
MSPTPSVLLVTSTQAEAEALRRAPSRGPATLVLVGASATLSYLFGAGRTRPGAWPGVVFLDLWGQPDAWSSVLQQVRCHEETEALPVVVLGPPGDDWAVLRACDLGADAFLSRPETADAVAAAVGEAASYWLSLTEEPQRDAG